LVAFCFCFFCMLKAADCPNGCIAAVICCGAERALWAIKQGGASPVRER